MTQVKAGWSKCLQRHSLAWSLAGGLGLSFFVGCSRTPPAPVETAEHEAAPAKAHGKSGSDSADSAGQRSANPKRPMIGDIPVDVWLDNPIAESKKTGSAAPPATAKTPDTVAAAKPAPMPEAAPAETAAAPAGGGDDWASILSAEDIQNEIKKIKNELTDSLSAIGKYNAHYKEIAMEGSVLAALASIAIVHPEKVSWKEHAPHVRDIATEMAKKSKGLGQKPFDDTKKEFVKLEGLLSGNPPPDLGEAVPDIPFSEVASRRGIMQRIQINFDYLKANFQTEAKLEKGQEDAAHMAAITAAITKVIGTEGYDSADEDEYKAFVKNMVDANLALVKSAKDKDFATFSDTNGKMGKFCTECHTAYQGTGS